MSVAEETAVEQPARTYTEAGGLSWAFAGAWRCAAMVVLLEIWLSSNFSELQVEWERTGWGQESEFLRIGRDVFFLSVAAFVACLLLGEEVAANRVQQTFKDIVSHAILGMLGAANLLFVVLLPVALLRLFNPGWPSW